MKRKLIKIGFPLLVAVFGSIVWFSGGTSNETAFARNVSPAHSVVDSKEMPAGAKAKFVLGKDSSTEYGDVAFDHNTHSYQKYSPDGKTLIGCAECHHTDQPKSALKPPYVTSERNAVLTEEELKKPGTPVVKACRTCHFQEGNIPDGKAQAVYADGKEINNELAYHINCNTCHDAAAKLRPELKKKPGFATTNDCFICHKKN